MSESKILTTTAGTPVADNQNALTAGPRGPGRDGQKGKGKRRNIPTGNHEGNPTAMGIHLHGCLPKGEYPRH